MVSAPSSYWKAEFSKWKEYLNDFEVLAALEWDENEPSKDDLQDLENSSNEGFFNQQISELDFSGEEGFHNYLFLAAFKTKKFAISLFEKIKDRNYYIKPNPRLFNLSLLSFTIILKKKEISHCLAENLNFRRIFGSHLPIDQLTDHAGFSFLDHAILSRDEDLKIIFSKECKGLKGHISQLGISSETLCEFVQQSRDDKFYVGSEEKEVRVNYQDFKNKFIFPLEVNSRKSLDYSFKHSKDQQNSRPNIFSNSISLSASLIYDIWFDYCQGKLNRDSMEIIHNYQKFHEKFGIKRAKQTHLFTVKPVIMNDRKTLLPTSFKISCVFRQSTEVGLGLFARKPIKPGNIISYWTGTLKRKTTNQGEYIYKFPSEDYEIDGTGLFGFNHIVNHGFPNARLVIDAKNGFPALIAIEEIKPGTQICYNYGSEYFQHNEICLEIREGGLKEFLKNNPLDSLVESLKKYEITGSVDTNLYQWKYIFFDSLSFFKMILRGDIDEKKINKFEQEILNLNQTDLQKKLAKFLDRSSHVFRYYFGIMENEECFKSVENELIDLVVQDRTLGLEIVELISEHYKPSTKTGGLINALLKLHKNGFEGRVQNEVVELLFQDQMEIENFLIDYFVPSEFIKRFVSKFFLKLRETPIYRFEIGRAFCYRYYPEIGLEIPSSTWNIFLKEDKTNYLLIEHIVASFAKFELSKPLNANFIELLQTPVSHHVIESFLKELNGDSKSAFIEEIKKILFHQPNVNFEKENSSLKERSFTQILFGVHDPIFNDNLIIEELAPKFHQNLVENWQYGYKLFEGLQQLGSESIIENTIFQREMSESPAMNREVLKQFNHLLNTPSPKNDIKITLVKIFRKALCNQLNCVSKRFQMSTQDVSQQVSKAAEQIKFHLPNIIKLTTKKLSRHSKSLEKLRTKQITTQDKRLTQSGDLKLLKKLKKQKTVNQNLKKSPEPKDQ